MITSRERIRFIEILNGFLVSDKEYMDTLNGYINLSGKHFIFTNMGKAAFEQVIINTNLRNSKILLPSFFPHDFVGIFRKYQISPIFVDVDPGTYQLDLSRTEREDIQGSRALILLHTFGLPADGQIYREFCDRHGMLLIEDCARAFGARRGTVPVGSWGDYAIFSLPKCTPVRQGGILVGNRPIRVELEKANLGLAGLFHALTLIKYPFSETLEYRIYKRIADTPIYPREVGIYDLLPSREFDRLGRFIFKSFLSVYRQAIEVKRQKAGLIRAALEPLGCTFQTDNGDHIYTSLSFMPPSGCDVDDLTDHLFASGIKVSTMWRDALGVSPLATERWGTDPAASPVTSHLSKGLIQLPISRFQGAEQTQKIIEACSQFLGGGCR